MSYMETSLSGLREERKHRLLKARVRSGRDEYDIVVKNVSSRGLGGISNDKIVVLGSSISVLLPSGQIVEGVVRWTDGRKFGLALTQEISADEELIDRNQEPASNWEVKRLHQVVTPRTDPTRLRRVT